MKPTIWVPHQYQQNAVNFCTYNFSVNDGAALFLDPGLGKTTTTLQIFKNFKDKGLTDKMLVIAPLRVAQSTWPGELRKWLNFYDLSYVVLHGPDKDRLAFKDVDIYIINYEGLDWLFSKSKFHKIDMLVFDELTRMKSWGAKRVKMLKPFLKVFKYRLGLTGTPAPNGLEDIFSQTYMLDMGARFGKSKTKFITSYFRESNPFSYKLMPLPGAKEAIFEKLESLAYSLNSVDHLELPAEVFNTIEVDMPIKHKKLYDTLKKDAIVQLESTEILTALTAAALTTKLRQFTSGAVYIKDTVEFIHDVKLQVLKDFVEDSTTPVLIGYQYRHEAERILDDIPGVVAIGSGTKASHLEKIITKWNNGEIKALLGHPQSIGHGLNLQGGGHTIVFFSLDFNLENYLQFIKRLSRQGQQSKHVFIHTIVMKNTIDEYVQSILAGKNKLQTNLLQFLQK